VLATRRSASTNVPSSERYDRALSRT